VSAADPGVGRRALGRLAGDADPAIRVGALVSLAVLCAAYLATLSHVADVTNRTTAFLALVGLAIGLAVLIGSTLTGRQAFLVGTGLLAAGLGWYLLAVPPSFWTDFSTGQLIADVVALLTGFSVLRLVQADVWALAVTPGPTFLLAYFGLRGAYVRAAAVGGATLGFFVLTGDSNTVTTLLGVLGATSALGFGVIARHGGTGAQVEGIAVAVAAMILASAAVTAVPAGGSQPLLTGAASAESDLRTVSDDIAIGGSVWLSPKVRFTVEAQQPAYWRVNAYDRFTGSGWTRTGDPLPLSDAPAPPGPRETVFQTVTAETTLDVLPAAGRPIEVTDVDARLTPQGTLASETTLSEGDVYTVVSRVPNASAAQLRNASTAYPDRVADRYRQLPDSTSDRVATLSDSVTAGADNPYDAASAVERWLEGNKNYSTTVPSPDGALVDAFLFEYDAGYCVYFATSMTAMLRSQGIPARYAVGYTPGQRVSESEWVVRGLDAHAWVEVYFPGYGWIPFDPTPGSERVDAETQALDDARTEGVGGVDAAGSADGSWTPSDTDNGTEQAPPDTVGGPGRPLLGTTTPEVNVSPGASGGNGSGLTGTSTATNATPFDIEGGDGSGGPIELPDLETLGLWSVLLVGLAAGGRRTGATDRVYRAVWLRVQPSTGDHRTDVEGAFARVEYVLGREHRPREPGETVREYLEAVDADAGVQELADLRERALYGGDTSPETARRARELADAAVSERVGLATRFNRSLS
jgi:transglutaminase-like putative cysteine protease